LARKSVLGARAAPMFRASKLNAHRSFTRTAQPHHRAVAPCVGPRSKFRAVPPSRARPPLLFPLRAGSWSWLSRKSDDLGCGIRSRRTASAACDRATCRRVLTCLIGDEIVEIGGGVHAGWARRALAEDDVAEITCGDVSVERLDRAVQLGGGLRGGQEPARHRLARLALAAGRRGSRDNCPYLGRLRLLSEQRLEAPRQAGAAIRRLRFLLALADAEKCLDAAVAPLVRNEDARTFARDFCDVRGLGHVPPPSTALHRSSPGSSRHRRAGALI